MFSGLIVEVGTIVAVDRGLVVDAPKTAGALVVGGSVCVNGVCLSAVDVGDSWFRADVSSETVHRSTLADLGVGEHVNLEVPLRVGDPFGGHLVQGHVDAVGKVTLLEEDEAGARRLWIRPPRRFMDDVIAKGSIAVNGVSLTVAEVVRDRLSVALIPLTLRATTLGSLAVDDRVNLEADLFVKSAHELHTAASLVASRSFAALPWAGELRGSVGVEKTAAQLAAGGAVVIHDPDREAEADVVFRRGSTAARVNGVPAHAGVRAHDYSLRSQPPGPAGDPTDAGRGRPTRNRLPRVGGLGCRRRDGRLRPRSSGDGAPPSRPPTPRRPTSCSLVMSFLLRDVPVV